MESTTLKDLRKRLGFSQSELGKRLGVSRKTILNYETGASTIPETKSQLLEIIANSLTLTEKTKYNAKRNQKPLLNENEIAKKILSGLTPYFANLEATVSNLKNEVEALILLLRIDKDLNDSDNIRN